jgi:hypothetical protein
MEEQEYKSIYNDMASVPCFFEKAISNRQAQCHLAKHFCLADREGYSCVSADSSVVCGEFLKKLRENCLFVFKMREIDKQLPHNMEIKVQAGGLQGLSKLLNLNSACEPVTVAGDINNILKRAVDNFGGLNKLPFSELIHSVKQFQARKRRRR